MVGCACFARYLVVFAGYWVRGVMTVVDETAIGVGVCGWVHAGVRACGCETACMRACEHACVCACVRTTLSYHNIYNYIIFVIILLDYGFRS